MSEKPNSVESEYNRYRLILNSKLNLNDDPKIKTTEQATSLHEDIYLSIGAGENKTRADEINFVDAFSNRVDECISATDKYEAALQKLQEKDETLVKNLAVDEVDPIYYTQTGWVPTDVITKDFLSKCMNSKEK